MSLNCSTAASVGEQLSSASLHAWKRSVSITKLIMASKSSPVTDPEPSTRNTRREEDGEEEEEDLLWLLMSDVGSVCCVSCGEVDSSNRTL